MKRNIFLPAMALLLISFFNQEAYSQSKDIYVNVEMYVTATTTSKQFDADNALTQKTETQVTYKVNQVLLLSDVLLKRILTQKQDFKFCNSRGGCVLLNGDNEMPSKVAAITKKRTYVVPYTFKQSKWTQCDGNMILIFSSETNGSVDNNHIGTQISALQTANVNGSFPYFQLFVNVGCGFGHSPVSSGTLLKTKTYDCDAKKWDTVEPNKYELCVNDYRVLNDINTSVSSGDIIDTYTPPVFDEAELTTFLKKAPGNKFAHSFMLKANEYHKSAAGEENTDIKINLVFLGTWEAPAN